MATRELFKLLETKEHLPMGLLSQPYEHQLGDGKSKKVYNVFSAVKTDGLPDLRQVATNINYGFNLAAQSLIQQPNKFDKGYVFFTRPQLCLRDENLLREPRLYSFLNSDMNSVHRYVRCLLDPRLSYQSAPKGNVGSGSDAKAVAELFASDGTIQSNMLDNTNPFLTILTNCLKSLSGWPDPASGFFVTEPNIGGGQTVFVDKHNRERGAFSLSATFHNPQGNALVLALWLWREVQALCWEGILDPYPDFIVNNQFDYKTAIYRFVMDERRDKIILPMKTIGTLDAPDIGRLGDYQHDAGKVREDIDLNVNFKCEGVDYFNPYILIEFNLTMGMGDPLFAKLITYDIVSQFSHVEGGKKRDEAIDKLGLAKVPKQLRQYFNFRAKPYVNLNTLELEWYVSKASNEYKTLIEHAPEELRKMFEKEDRERAKAELENEKRVIDQEHQDMMHQLDKDRDGYLSHEEGLLDEAYRKFIEVSEKLAPDKEFTDTEQLAEPIKEATKKASEEKTKKEEETKENVEKSNNDLKTSVEKKEVDQTEHADAMRLSDAKFSEEVKKRDEEIKKETEDTKNKNKVSSDKLNETGKKQEEKIDKKKQEDEARIEQNTEKVIEATRNEAKKSLSEQEKAKDRVERIEQEMRRFENEVLNLKMEKEYHEKTQFKHIKLDEYVRIKQKLANKEQWVENRKQALNKANEELKKLTEKERK